MVKWNKRQILPIGLDIGHDTVKLLQLEVIEGALHVHAAAAKALNSILHPAPQKTGLTDLLPPGAAEAIGELLRHGDFHGRKVIAALPRQIVHIKNLRLPPMPVSEMASVVQFESRNLFPFDQEEGHVDFLSAGEVRQGSEVRQEVIVLGARCREIDRFIEQLHAAGAIVESLDAEPCGLYRCIERFVRRRDDEQEVHVLIDVGMHRTQVLIGKGREISFFKTIEGGGARFNDAVSRKLGITSDEARAIRRRLATAGSGEAAPESVRQAVFDATRSGMEELTKEISLCLRYYSVTFRGQRPARVRLLGGEAYDPQLLATLTSVLNVPVEAARPLFSVNCERMAGFDNKKPSPEWALAMGLGLKRATGTFPPKDGTPRAAAATTVRVPATAEVVDLNTAITPGATSREAAAQSEHFANVRRSATEEAARA
jgi:type IV pilus assembly protein PilM